MSLVLLKTWGVVVFLNSGSFFSRYMSRSGVTRSDSSSVFSTVFRTILHSGCTISIPSNSPGRAPFAPCPLQHLLCVHLQGGRPGFDPWVGKFPWKRAWRPTPVVLPGESPWTEEPDKLQQLLGLLQSKSQTQQSN